MNKIKIYRKNDFFGAMNIIKVTINNQTHELPSNSNISVDCKSDTLSVQAKYLWIASKKIIFKNNNPNCIIRIAPFINNFQIVGSALTIMFLFIMMNVLESELIKFFFRLFSISFMLIIFFFITVGSRYYFKISFTEQN